MSRYLHCHIFKIHFLNLQKNDNIRICTLCYKNLSSSLYNQNKHPKRHTHNYMCNLYISHCNYHRMSPYIVLYTILCMLYHNLLYK